MGKCFPSSPGTFWEIDFWAASLHHQAFDFSVNQSTQPWGCLSFCFLFHTYTSQQDHCLQKTSLLAFLQTLQPWFWLSLRWEELIPWWQRRKQRRAHFTDFCKICCKRCCNWLFLWKRSTATDFIAVRESNSIQCYEWVPDFQRERTWPCPAQKTSEKAEKHMVFTCDLWLVIKALEFPRFWNIFLYDSCNFSLNVISFQSQVLWPRFSLWIDLQRIEIQNSN